jgi:hypothetical protein
MNEIEMRVQIHLDGTEISETSEGCDGEHCINRSKNQAKPPRTTCTLAEPRQKDYYAADEMRPGGKPNGSIERTVLP